jgi:hypothetical protein
MRWCFCSGTAPGARGLAKLGARRAAQVRDAGNLLTRAGLSIPAVDVDELTVHYRQPAELVAHLRCATMTAY